MISDKLERKVQYFKMQATPGPQKQGGGRPLSSAHAEYKKENYESLKCRHCDKAVSDKSAR